MKLLSLIFIFLLSVSGFASKLEGTIMRIQPEALAQFNNSEVLSYRVSVHVKGREDTLIRTSFLFSFDKTRLAEAASGDSGLTTELVARSIIQNFLVETGRVNQRLGYDLNATLIKPSAKGIGQSDAHYITHAFNATPPSVESNGRRVNLPQGTAWMQILSSTQEDIVPTMDGAVDRSKELVRLHIEKRFPHFDVKTETQPSIDFQMIPEQSFGQWSDKLTKETQTNGTELEVVALVNSKVRPTLGTKIKTFAQKTGSKLSLAVRTAPRRAGSYLWKNIKNKKHMAIVMSRWTLVGAIVFPTVKKVAVDINGGDFQSVWVSSLLFTMMVPAMGSAGFQFFKDRYIGFVTGVNRLTKKAIALLAKDEKVWETLANDPKYAELEGEELVKYHEDALFEAAKETKPGKVLTQSEEYTRWGYGLEGLFFGIQFFGIVVMNAVAGVDIPFVDLVQVRHFPTWSDVGETILYGVPLAVATQGLFESFLFGYKRRIESALTRAFYKKDTGRELGAGVGIRDPKEMDSIKERLMKNRVWLMADFFESAMMVVGSVLSVGMTNAMVFENDVTVATLGTTLLAFAAALWVAPQTITKMLVRMGNKTNLLGGKDPSAQLDTEVVNAQIEKDKALETAQKQRVKEAKAEEKRQQIGIEELAELIGDTGYRPSMSSAVSASFVSFGRGLKKVTELCGLNSLLK